MLNVRIMKIFTIIAAVLSLLFGVIFLLRDKCSIIEPARLVCVMTGKTDIAGDKPLLVKDKKIRENDLRMRIFFQLLDKKTSARRELLSVFSGTPALIFGTQPSHSGAK